MTGSGAEAAALERSGRAAFAGFRLRSLASTTSTQDVVRAAARAGAAAGFCCMAASQSSGRGRQQRRWVAPEGSSLLASTLVRVSRAPLGAVPIAAGLAVRAAIEATSGCAGALKWPNDVVVAGGKLAGVLCEVEPAAPGTGAAVVIGVGVNLRVPSFPAGIAGASLHELVATPPSPPALLGALLPALAERLEVLEARGVAGLRGEWMAHAVGIGAVVTATSAAGRLSGVARGIDDDGALLLQTGGATTRVLAGDVHIVPDGADV